MKYYPAWGWQNPKDIVTIRCHGCKKAFSCRLSGNRRTAEMPKHGKTPDMTCVGGGKWYTLKESK